eukprot:CAMPEP_0170816080 /NCGR_PEP_ID=MMETSP0733-20121128/38977_1 /TAXON_ID=186038 /ORGANISM="Fragilariopsis kerguelensis, Strain L26-C5" /LENGTH=36 /DNA_ID= /DNA_START= /DNA_END= /DNA_ORIENTATION=
MNADDDPNCVDDPDSVVADRRIVAVSIPVDFLLPVG